MTESSALYISNEDLLPRRENLSIKEIDLSHFTSEIYDKILTSSIVFYTDKRIHKSKILKSRYINRERIII
jgi:hypothetical protein